MSPSVSRTTRVQIDTPVKKFVSDKLRPPAEETGTLSNYLTYQLLTTKLTIMATKRKIRTSKVPRRSQPPSAQTAYVALLSTADKLKTLFEALCAPFDITAQQYNVLRILRGAEPEGLPTLMIAERMIESTPGITRMIDRLESKGLVTREIRPHDRRCVYCRITEKGLNVLEALDEPCEESNCSAFRGLTSAELKQLTTLLLKTRKAHETDK
jgi:DNA-binding MarR family transcriptional regulator